MLKSLPLFSCTYLQWWVLHLLTMIRVIHLNSKYLSTEYIMKFKFNTFVKAILRKRWHRLQHDHININSGKKTSPAAFFFFFLSPFFFLGGILDTKRQKFFRQKSKNCLHWQQGGCYFRWFPGMTSLPKVASSLRYLQCLDYQYSFPNNK